MSVSIEQTCWSSRWSSMTKQSIVLLASCLCLSIVFFSLIDSTTTTNIDVGETRIGQSSALSANRKGNVTILMMFPDIDRFIPNLQSLLIVYEYIVHRYQISKWLNVNLHVKDSNCSISLAPHMLVKTMLSTIPDVVFGPFCGEKCPSVRPHSSLVYFRSRCCTCGSSSSFSKYSSDHDGSRVEWIHLATWGDVFDSLSIWLSNRRTR